MNWLSSFRNVFFSIVLAGSIVFALACDDEPSGSNGSWLKGDLHSHTTYSDGDSPVRDVIDKAESVGLDYFAITDHDGNMNGIPLHWSDPEYQSDSLILLYGIEWTTDRGHANIFGTEPYDYSELWQAHLNENAAAAIEAAHDRGLHFSINHPTGFKCGWEYGYNLDMDSLEIWNSMYLLPTLNAWTTHVVWDDLLLSGRRIAARGSSDTHQHKGWQNLLFNLGNPTTWVYSESRDAASILESLKNGHASISYAPDAERIDFIADVDGDGLYESIIGDNVSAKSGATVNFKITIANANINPDKKGTVTTLSAADRTALSQGTENQKPSLKTLLEGSTYAVALFKNGTLCRAWVLKNTDMVSFTDIPANGSRSYYRVELRGNSLQAPILGMLLYGRILALTNPIYFNY